MRLRLNSNRAGDQGVQRTAVIVLGMVATVIGCALAYIGFKAPDSVPGRSYYNLEAEFLRADNLADHYQVRLGGRLIGQVLNPRVREGRAIVDLQLKKDVQPLLSDTTLRVRPRSAIGVRYVDVTPGTKGTPLEEGATIAAKATSAAQPIDVAFGILDRRRREKLKTLLDKLGAGTAGRGEDLNVALGKGSEFFAGLDTSLGAVNRRPGAVAGFVSGLDTLASAAAPVRDDIAEGFRPEAEALEPFSEQGDAVRAALSEAGPTLAAARDQLPPTRALLARTAGFARAATPTLRSAPAAFRQASALLSEAKPSLRAADETLHLAERAVSPTLGLLRTVRPVLPAADDTFVDGLPLVRTLSAYSCDVTTWGVNWGDATARGNAGGQFLRLAFVSPGLQQLAGDRREPFDAGVGQNPYPEPCKAGTEPKP
jgi:ABC-type transporter Mla subunit MlaD